MRTPLDERIATDTACSEPERKCILSGVYGSRGNLIRLAISPAGEVLPDVHARAPGRGAWIAVSRAELEKALEKGELRRALARAFGKSLAGAPFIVPADLPERIEAALTRALTDRLGLEFRIGKLLLGSDRIAENARTGRISWLGHAADAGEDGSKKLDQAWRVGAGSEGSGLKGIALPLDRGALSVALGRDNVVHVALTDPAAAERVALLLQRLLYFQGRAEATGIDVSERTARGAAPFARMTNRD